MKISVKDAAAAWAAAVLLLTSACSSGGDAAPAETVPAEAGHSAAAQPATPAARPTPAFPDLQAELLDGRDKTSRSPLADFDFKNHSYPLPRGWQNPDDTDATLVDGRIEPVSADTDVGMEPEEIAELKARRRIGMSLVTTKFLDATGDGSDEAVVILKVETTGTAIPQLVYVYEWKDGKPILIWNFRTGDRADGGLKDVRAEDGSLVVELFGQDRFILGEVETGKITGDEEQICCPTFFTRTAYRWNGRNFLLQGKRLTFSTSDKTAPPLENYGEVVNAREKTRKQVAKR